MAKIGIIGGGIAGLSAAYDLSRDGTHQVTLFESSGRLGGKILTHSIDGMIVEGGPDSIFTSKPWAVQLMTELGLESDFEEPIGGGFSVMTNGKLHAVPRALAGLIPTASTALESVGFLSAAARKRITSEHTVKKGSGEDESVASFFRRRFGKHFSKTLAEPLLAGIHAGDAEKLSMKALYPTYIGLEQKHGSLSGAVSNPSATPTGHAPKKAGFLTLRGGLAELVTALVQKLDSVDIRLSCSPKVLLQTETGIKIQISDSDSIEVDAVILAVPAYASAKLLSSIRQDASMLLSSIRHASTAVATVAFRASAFHRPLSGNGFLVPADEDSDVTGCTYSSLKWAGRAPQETILIRAFMGRDGGLNIDTLSDDELLTRAESSLRRLLDAHEAPIMSRVDRWSNAMPQYELGHLELMDKIESQLEGLPIQLAGTSYRGTGVPDCIRQGREAAERFKGL